MDKPCMDNQRLILVSETRTDFDLGMQLAFRHAPGGKAWSWWVWNVARPEYDKDRPENGLGVIRGAPTLVLSWEGSKPTGKYTSNPYISVLPKEKTALPFGMSWETASQFAWDWLQQQEYTSEPDHDGSNGKGFILFNDPWGHVGSDHYAIIAIGPAWAMRGK